MTLKAALLWFGDFLSSSIGPAAHRVLPRDKPPDASGGPGAPAWPALGVCLAVTSALGYTGAQGLTLV